MTGRTPMNTTTKATAMEGFDVWFFGGTPGPDDFGQGTSLAEPAAIDEDDARIPAFAHHCDCGKPASKNTHAVRKPMLACAFG